MKLSNRQAICFITLILQLSVYLFLPFCGNAQLISTQSYALARIYTVLEDDAWSGFQNPATRYARTIALQIQRPYGIPELDEPALAASMNSGNMAGAIGLSSGGIPGFRILHSVTSISMGWDAVRVGTAFRVNQIQLPSPYRNDTAILFDAGILFPVHRDISAGIVVRNATGSRWRIGGTETDREIAAGIRWKTQVRVTWYAQLASNARQNEDVALGVEWQPLQALKFRTGIGSNPGRLAFGTGFYLGRWAADISMERHEEYLLGWTPAFGITYIWGKKR